MTVISFIRKDYQRPGVDGLVRPSVVVVYSLIHDEQTNSTITAAPEGVSFRGYWPVISVDECDVLIRQIMRAATVADVLSLRPLKPPTEERIDELLQQEGR